VQLANHGWEAAVRSNKELELGLNVVDGKIVYEAVAEAFEMPYTPLASILG
jgi:alanine dehydrogenase